MPRAHATASIAILLTVLLAASPATTMAQEVERNVIQVENVRMDYAQVMRVRPVYQTLHATRMEQRCKTPGGVVVVEPKDGEKGRFERFVDAVRDVLSPDEVPRTVDAVPRDAIDCDVVRVEREFRRAIAYDVDYVYKGAKYRSRLPHDPGNHLRVRVSVTPVVGPVGNP
ncbi:MAG TPA: hypothetical protein VFM73_10140 [Xanthomonadaceae bacterium]|nr:hypothetical protein [Xanthomonadaceae bacterium]